MGYPQVEYHEGNGWCICEITNGGGHITHDTGFLSWDDAGHALQSQESDGVWNQD